MDLILNGGGVGQKCATSYKEFANRLRKNSVLFIPFANDEMTYEEAFSWFQREVKPFGIDNIQMVEQPTLISKAMLSSFGGIYISGGNAFKLLAILKSCKAFQIIKDFLKEDGVIMGSSAGVTIFGKSANSCLKDELRIAASDRNYVNLKETDGFDAVCGHSFFVHYQLKESQLENTEKRVQSLLKDGHNLICLPEETSLLVENGKMSFIGEKPAEVITQTYRKTISPNEYFQLEQ